MSQQEVFYTIKSTVHAFLPNAQILLFGSRARGNNDKNSDYDLLVITPQSYEPRERIHWESKISKALIKLFRIPFDVIVQSNEDVNVKKSSRGHIVYYALKDAIEI